WPRAFSPHFHDTIMAGLRGSGFVGPVEEMVIFGSRLLVDDPTACADIAACRAFGIGFEGQYRALEPEFVWRQIDPAIPIPMHLTWRRDASAAVRNFVSVVLEVMHDQQLMGDERRHEAERLLAA